VSKEDIEKEEKIDIETHFLPATPVKEENPLQRLYYSLNYHTMFSSLKANNTNAMLFTLLLLGIILFSSIIKGYVKSISIKIITKFIINLYLGVRKMPVC